MILALGFIIRWPLEEHVFNTTIHNIGITRTSVRDAWVRGSKGFGNPGNTSLLRTGRIREIASFSFTTLILKGVVFGKRMNSSWFYRENPASSSIL